MDKDLLKGIKISFGIVLGLSLFFGIVFAIGFHSANEITSGSFIGNFDFSGATVTGLPTTSLQKSNTSICNLANEGNLRYNPTTKSYEGCSINRWKKINNIGCDYEINRNCWVEVWKATKNDYNTNLFNYSNNYAISQATAFAFGYVDSTGILSNTFYTLDNSLITSLKATHPLNHNQMDISTTMYDINTGNSAGSGTFRAGYYTFNNNCGGNWAIGSYGRICLSGINDFPYYNGFYYSGNDLCSISDVNHGAITCSDDRRFIILAKVN